MLPPTATLHSVKIAAKDTSSRQATILYDLKQQSHVREAEKLAEWQIFQVNNHVHTDLEIYAARTEKKSPKFKQITFLRIQIMLHIILQPEKN